MSVTNYHRAISARLNRFWATRPGLEWVERRMDEAWALYAGKLGL